jgi:preprotein translocase subunit SecD
MSNRAKLLKPLTTNMFSLPFDFPRWKTLLALLFTVVGLLLSIPNFVPQATLNSWPSFAQKHLSLGLDLSGGSHLLLEADVSDIKKLKLDSMQNQLNRAINNASPAIAISEISQSNGQLSFFVTKPADVERAREITYNQTKGTGVGERDWQVQIVDSTRITMTPSVQGLNEDIANIMGTAREVVARRIDPTGTKEITVVRQGNNRILVEVPGVQDPEGLKTIIGKTAKLEFRMVDDGADSVMVAKGLAPAADELMPLMQNGVPAGKIAVSRIVKVTGDQLTKAEASRTDDGLDDIAFTFNAEASTIFAHLTQENIGKRFAVILDGTVISAPVIKSAITGGSGTISGGFTAESARQLATQLSSGKLPVPLKVVQESTIGPELGVESIQKGILAGSIAMGLLAIFMVLTYLRFGVYTTIALVINAFMILGVMALVGATLTLPGIAGFVLTLGAAVDANVLINERIREESHRGRQPLQAVEFGYKEASHAIFDANITHIISALIMMYFGSGPVRGFAVVLAIGIITSVFTGVTLSRLMVADWFRRKRPTRINL